MNLLEYGMKYRNSKSKMRRLAAKCALGIEKHKADRYEARINKRMRAVSQDPEEAAALLRSIREQLAQQPLKEELGERETADQDAVSG